MILFLFSILLLFSSCSDISNNGNPLLNIDLKPPVLQSVLLENSNSLTVSFDEPVSFSKEDYNSDPLMPLASWNESENAITFIFEVDQVPGTLYKCRSSASDDSGNTLSFIIRYYGWNPEIPEMVINEFNPEGSDNNPDTIELFALSDGNTAGMTLFLGTKNNYSDSYILPDLNVEKNDYIIVHMRPEGLTVEITETDDKAVSEGKLYSDDAWDLWVDGDKPISGNNGVITLYSNPFGDIIDAVPYSNRVTADSEDYRGWTAATINMIEELSFLEIWENTGGFIRPEDAVYSEGTTGTRSICRNSSSHDSDAKDDWHIVPTGEKSFGQVNSDNVYIP